MAVGGRIRTVEEDARGSHEAGMTIRSTPTPPPGERAAHLPRPSPHSLLAGAVALGLTALIYWPTLGGSFMYDASIDFPRATDRGVAEVLTDAGASNYYRPLPLLVWKGLYLLLGRNDPVVLHALMLAAHALAGWLVYQLARRLLDVFAGLVAAALFLWHPAGYQVVGFVNSVYHSLVAVGVAGAVVLYFDARRQSLDPGPRALRWAGALGLAMLGMLSHESGVAVLPIVAGLELVLWRTGQAPRPALRPLAAFGAAVAGFASLWALAGREPSRLALEPGSLRSNGLYFLQGLAAPVTSQLAALPVPSGGEALMVLLVSAAVLLGLFGLLGVRRRLGVGVFGLLWFLAAVAPVWLARPWEPYVANGPRLLYLGSMGAALLWAAALAPAGGLLAGRSGGGLALNPAAASPRAERLSGRAGGPGSATEGAATLWRPAAASVVGLAAVLLILAAGYRFLSLRASAIAEGGRVLEEVFTTATASSPTAGRTYVNLPAFLTPRDRGFLVGHWGVTLISDYIYELGLPVYVARGARPDLRSLAYADIWQQAPYLFGMHGAPAGLEELERAFRQGGGVYLARFREDGLRLEYVGQVSREARIAPPLARFDAWADLLEASARLAGEQLEVRLLWQARGPAPGDFTVFVHLVDGGGRLLAQADGYPLGAMFPPQRWRSGDLVEDVRWLRLPPAGSGELRLLVGLYDRSDPTRRAQARDGEGGQFAANAVPVAVAAN